MSKSQKSCFIIAKTEVASLHTGPAWAHVVRACLSHNFLLPIQIMNTIGGFTPGAYIKPKVSGRQISSSNSKFSDLLAEFMDQIFFVICLRT